MLHTRETTEVPEWETYAPRKNEAAPTQQGGGPFIAGPKISFREKAVGALDKRMPSHKRYCGMKRRTVLILIALGILLAILALIIGLAVGLTRQKYALPPITLGPESSNRVQ